MPSQNVQDISKMSEDGDMDLVNRDPNNLNDHVKVTFEDILGEPEAAHSLDCVWQNSFRCFNYGKNCCYKLMTTLCGICLGLFWGCEFAVITFDHVWCFTPSLRAFSIYLGCCQKFFSACINCFLAPICETCGLCFSKITVSQ